MKNNPFEAHGVEHLSPSSINQFISSPCHWLMKVAGHKIQSNPAMWRGTAVDEGVCASIFDDDSLENKQDKARMIARQSFTREEDFAKHDVDRLKADKEYEKLNNYVDVAVLCYDNIGKKPLETQKKVEVEFEELPIPIIGFIDVLYDDHLRDIKTMGRFTDKVPSNISRQLSVYAYAEKKPAFADFVFTNTKGSHVDSHEITDVDKHIGVVKKVAYSMMNVLSYSDDIRTVASLMYPDFDHWMWSDHDKEFATQLWDI